MNVTKICAHCGKPFAHNGRQKFCSADCALAVDEQRHREQARRYYAENRERILAKRRRQYHEHLEEARATQRFNNRKRKALAQKK